MLRDSYRQAVQAVRGLIVDDYDVVIRCPTTYELKCAYLTNAHIRGI